MRGFYGSNREICKGFGADDFCLQCLFFMTAMAPMKFWTTFFAAKNAPTQGCSACLKPRCSCCRARVITRSCWTAICSRVALPAPQKVDVVPFEDVTADCAAAEGDGTLAVWKKAHRKAFAAACEEIGRNFNESMKCVCEYFDVVYRADGQ